MTSDELSEITQRTSQNALTFLGMLFSAHPADVYFFIVFHCFSLFVIVFHRFLIFIDFWIRWHQSSGPGDNGSCGGTGCTGGPGGLGGSGDPACSGGYYGGDAFVFVLILSLYLS